MNISACLRYDFALRYLLIFQHTIQTHSNLYAYIQITTSFHIIAQNKINLSMEQSLILKQSLKESIISASNLNTHKQLSFQDKIDHMFCDCFHCINNTKPIFQQTYPRIKSTLQYQFASVEAYHFFVTKMSNYPGRALLPQIYLVQSSGLIWYNSSQEKIKLKQNVSAMDVKKHFDAKKLKYLKALKERNNSIAPILAFGISLTQSFNSKMRANTNNHQSLQITNPSYVSTKIKNAQNQMKQMKQVAMINYANNFSQIVTDPLLTKYLAKRKNDSFWSQVSTIVLIPPYKESQLTYHDFYFYRNSRVVQNLDKLMKIIAKIVDQQRQSSVNPQTQITNAQSQQQLFTQNSQKTQDKSLAKQTLRNFFKSLNLSQEQNPDKKKIQIISYELIAYIEIMYNVRILQVRMKFIIDHQENCYLMEVQKFIAAPLKDTEKFMVHDRLKPLDQLFLDEVNNFKLSLNFNEQQELKTNIAELVADCLQKRKTQLKTCVYNRPSKQKLIQIFQRIFPNFRQMQFFKNSNWRNQIQSQLQNFRSSISKMIRSDEGIRILKRFGIQFYRTWN